MDNDNKSQPGPGGAQQAGTPGGRQAAQQQQQKQGGAQQQGEKPRTGDVTNPDVVRPEADPPFLTGADSEVKKGPANVIEEEKLRREGGGKMGGAQDKGQMQEYEVVHGDVQYQGEAQDGQRPMLTGAKGSTVRMNSNEARHLVDAGALKPKGQ